MLMQDRLTICHLLYSFGGGGMENVLSKIINGLDPNKYRHVVVTISDDISLRCRISVEGTEFYKLTSRNVILRVKELRDVIYKEKINLIHARGWPFMLEASLLSLITGKPSIFSFHGKTIDDLGHKNIKRHIMEIVLARTYDEIMTLTPAMQIDLMSSFMLKNNKIRVIPNGVPEPVLCCDSRKKARNNLGISNDEFVIGFAGRFDKVKDLNTLVLAFDIFVKNNPSSRLVLIGDGECKEQLKDLIHTRQIEQKVIITGFCNQVQEIMQAFDIYVQTSLYEGLSNTILEALSVGLPVICTDVGGNGDIILDGINGFLVQSGDSEDCSSKIEELYKNPELRKVMSANNIMRHKTTYLIAKMIESYDIMYCHCLGL